MEEERPVIERNEQRSRLVRIQVRADLRRIPGAQNHDGVDAHDEEA
jgi:hypothetical protein